EAQEGKHALIPIVQHDPAETVGLAILSMERRVLAIDAIEIPHELLHAGMHRLIKREPVQSPIVVPFPLLSELAAHEQELLARMRPHEAEIGPQIGEALPLVTRHPAEQR